MNNIFSVKDWLKNNQDWVLKDNKLVLVKKFEDFQTAWSFVNRACSLAQEQNHHPLLEINIKQVTLTLFTHDADSITDQDLRFATIISHSNYLQPQKKLVMVPFESSKFLKDTVISGIFVPKDPHNVKRMHNCMSEDYVRIDFIDCVLENFNFSASNFEKCTFKNAIFKNCSFEICLFKNCDVSGFNPDKSCIGVESIEQTKDNEDSETNSE